MQGQPTKRTNIILLTTKFCQANNYYRLKQIDFDGAYNYSKIISVSFKTGNEGSFEVFPNPTDGSFSIAGIDVEFVDDIHICDQFGEKIKSVQPTEFSIDISELPNGIYYITAILKSQKLAKKLIVNKY